MRGRARNAVERRQCSSVLITTNKLSTCTRVLVRVRRPAIRSRNRDPTRGGWCEVRNADNCWVLGEFKVLFIYSCV